MVGTGEAGIEGSMGKGFVKDLNLHWVFEVCKKKRVARLKVSEVPLWVILKVWLMKIILI